MGLEVTPMIVRPVLAGLLFTGLLASTALAAVSVQIPGLSIQVGDEERRLDRGGRYGGVYYPKNTVVCCFRNGKFDHYAYHGSHGRNQWRDWNNSHEQNGKDHR
jgi:hypothetical protein